MESNEMIYTAIFQNPQGKLIRMRYTATMNRSETWLDATKMGASDGNCLIALVSGDHPVYFYENFVEDNARQDRTAAQNHDLFELPEEEDVYQMT
jgi:hypothetical protein